MTRYGKPKQQLSNLRYTRSPKVFKDLCRKYRNRLCIVSEGDSWFAYPREFIIVGRSSNVIDFLKKILRKQQRKYNLLEMAQNGDEIVDIASGESKFDILNVIRDSSVDFLLISGAGNDFVGKFDFEFVLRRNPGGTKPGDYINIERFNRKLTQIRHAYRDLIEYCDEFSKNKDIKIITHTYGYIKPQNKPARFIGGLIESGPWVYPALRKFRVPKEHWNAITRMLINRLRANFKALHDSSNGRFHYVDSALFVTDDDWIDEIHLKPEGFERLAQEIYNKMMDLNN